MKNLLIISILILLNIPFLKANTFADTGKIYVFESDANGFNTKTVFYDDGKEVIAFDAQFTEQAAQQAIDFLKTKTTHPIKWLVITHPNPDKFNGIATFKKIGVKVIMSKLTAQNLKAVHAYKKYYFVEIAKMFTEATYPQLSTPDITFDETYELKTTKGNIILKELKQSGVSNNQTLAFIKSSNALIVGDLVHYKAHAWLEGPIENGKTAYNAQNWLNVLKKLQKNYAKDITVYGGRGEAGNLEIVITQQIQYLEKATQITKTYIESLSGATWAEKKAKVDYKVLTQIFEQTFPNYGLSYMITYGAYGLVASL